MKWISPKGDVSKDEISQLLLANLAAGGDIMELREIFNEDMVRAFKKHVAFFPPSLSVFENLFDCSIYLLQASEIELLSLFYHVT